MSDTSKTRYGIAEWYGKSFTSLKAPQRAVYAKHALGEADDGRPRCPFQANQPPCSKKGGVCSIQRYTKDAEGRLGDPVGEPVITCPNRRWGAKLAVGDDRPFFDAIGGTSAQPSHDVNEGDIIWLVARLDRTNQEGLRLVRDHWEVLTLEDSNKRLQDAETVGREDFEKALRSRLRPLTEHAF